MKSELAVLRARLQRPKGLMISGVFLNAALADVFGLVDTLAAMTTDEEMEGDMSGDDASEALSNMIVWAREQSGRRPDGQAEAAADMPPKGDAYRFASGDMPRRLCTPCGGTGEIIEYPADEDERTVCCPGCGGTGENFL